MTELSQLPSGLLRALGLPQSAELPAPPAACRWPAAASQVESYGQPAAPPHPAELGEEYLKGLKALGYL
jgi:hypothetical protein